MDSKSHIFRKCLGFNFSLYFLSVENLNLFILLGPAGSSAALSSDLNLFVVVILEFFGNLKLCNTILKRDLKLSLTHFHDSVVKNVTDTLPRQCG